MTTLGRAGCQGVLWSHLMIPAQNTTKKNRAREIGAFPLGVQFDLFDELCEDEGVS